MTRRSLRLAPQHAFTLGQSNAAAVLSNSVADTASPPNTASTRTCAPRRRRIFGLSLTGSLQNSTRTASGLVDAARVALEQVYPPATVFPAQDSLQMTLLQPQVDHEALLTILIRAPGKQLSRATCAHPSELKGLDRCVRCVPRAALAVPLSDEFANACLDTISTISTFSPAASGGTLRLVSASRAGRRGLWLARCTDRRYGTDGRINPTLRRRFKILPRGERHPAWASKLRQEHRAAAVPCLRAKPVDLGRPGITFGQSCRLPPYFGFPATAGAALPVRLASALTDSAPPASGAQLGFGSRRRQQRVAAAVPHLTNHSARVLGTFSRRSKDFAPRQAAPFLDSKQRWEQRGAAALPLFPDFDAARLGPAATFRPRVALPRSMFALMYAVLELNAHHSTARCSAD
uniref:Uncharacterized protein n=1 Tax=Mycena chlorophos TaxID=658473 RepID=A0ABQ0KV86_MYCCL|nr:predicted protein [Mycena chlorophos]